MAEVFSTNSASQRKCAFTLAEVLITLGIIGVVAAMTIPTLLGKSDKVVNVNRLKKAYSVIGNIFLRAQADYGDISGWDLSSSFNSTLKDEQFTSDAIEVGYPFFQKYIIPYVQNVKFAKKITLSELGYKENIKRRNGSDAIKNDSELMVLVLNDGITIIFSYTVCCDIETGEVRRGENGEKYLYGFLFVVDVNGPQRPNTLGKDIFLMSLAMAQNSKFGMYRGSTTHTKNGVSTITYKDLPRSTILSDCLDKGNYCGLLIQQDGWQIKDDYGW